MELLSFTNKIIKLYEGIYETVDLFRILDEKVEKGSPYK